MATFLISALNSDPIFFISSFDPAIDWKRTEEEGLSRREYQTDPLGLASKLKRFDGQDFIKFELIPPRQVDTIIASELSGVTLDQSQTLVFDGSTDLSEQSRLAVGYQMIGPFLAKLCIADVYNLDHFPSPCRKPFAGSTHILTEEASELIPDVVLEEVGQLLLKMDDLGKILGSEYDPFQSGTQSKDGSSIQTDVNSVEMEKSEDSGVVIGARSQQDQEEMML